MIDIEKLKKLRFKKGGEDSWVSYDFAKQSKLKVPDFIQPFPYERLPEFLAELDHVAHLVNNNIWPQEFFEKYYPFKGECPKKMPAILSRFGMDMADPRSCALAVQMDNPLEFAMHTMEWLFFDKGATPKNTLPEKGRNPFAEGYVRSLSVAGQMVHAAISLAMVIKYDEEVGFVPRPEEVWSFVTGIKNPECFTSYPEGSPNHASKLAGHAAIFGATAKAADECWELGKFEEGSLKKEVYDAAYIASMCRSLARVHWAMDNIEGLKLSLNTDMIEQDFAKI